MSNLTPTETRRQKLLAQLLTLAHPAATSIRLQGEQTLIACFPLAAATGLRDAQLTIAIAQAGLGRIDEMFTNSTTGQAVYILRVQ